MKYLSLFLLHCYRFASCVHQGWDTSRFLSQLINSRLVSSVKCILGPHPCGFLKPISELCSSSFNTLSLLCRWQGDRLQSCITRGKQTQAGSSDATHVFPLTLSCSTVNRKGDKMKNRGAELKQVQRWALRTPTHSDMVLKNFLKPTQAHKISCKERF